MSIIFQELCNRGLETNNPEIHQQLNAITSEDVLKELAQPIKAFSFQRALTFLSPAAEKHLEAMAKAAYKVTRQRFGNTMALYAPLYVSNYCCNKCIYCGFNSTHSIKRSRLTIDEAISEAKEIRKAGFTDLLLVTGEDPAKISVDYLCELSTALREIFSTISIEIYPVDEEAYHKMFLAGVDGMTLYQETYDSKLYPSFHPSGPKADYAYRLTVPENAAKAGMRQIGIGALLGLSDWRYEALCVATHAEVLIKNYWRSKVSISFPRMRPAEGVNPEWLRPVSDTNLTQIILAMRLCFSDAGLVLSTRESKELRDNLLPLGLTRISAGSKTNPGGYQHQEELEGTEQFAIADERTPEQVVEMLVSKGFDPVWKDWDYTYFKKEA